MLLNPSSLLVLAGAKDQASIDAVAVNGRASAVTAAELLKRKPLGETPAPTAKRLKTESSVTRSVQRGDIRSIDSVSTKRKTGAGHRALGKRSEGGGDAGISTSADGNDRDANGGPAGPSTKIGKSTQLGRLRGKYKTKPKDPSTGNASKPRRVRQKAGAKLRKGRKVVTEVPLDVWHHILSFCPPKFLGKARLISKDFYRALEYESAWKENRQNYYGVDMPGPLPGMREDQYVSLLEGRGCMGCGSSKTRKCYWIFQKRWCLTCLEKNTIKVNPLGAHLFAPLMTSTGICCESVACRLS
jgi:F-box domain